MEWKDIESAPKDGTPIWAFLNDAGIRLLRWWTAEEIAGSEDSDDPSLWQEGWYEVSDNEEGWSPRYWLPHEFIPEPPK